MILVLLRTTRNGVLPGTHVAGVDVGTLSETELEQRLHELNEEIAATDVTLRRTGGGAPPRTFRADGGDAGFRIDVVQTASVVLERGRQMNPLAALTDHVRAFFVSTQIDVVPEIDETRWDEWIRAAGESLSDAPREGAVRFQALEVVPVYPEPGIGVDLDGLGLVAREAMLARDEEAVELPAVTLAPRTDRADVDALIEVAERAISGPVMLTRGDLGLMIEPQLLTRLLDVEVVEGDDPGLTLVVDPRRLRANLDERFAELETEPVDATFSVSGGEVVVVPSQSGFAYTPQRAARQIMDLAVSEGDRRAPLRGEKVKPSFTTKDARSLHVTEQVSSFTTYHSCCEPRVENIHRAADIIDGTIVEPGQVFSLNEAIGPRTIETGFLAAPAISEGEFVQEVGGGISQLATTTFNTIFFGGYDLLEYKAHSYYISRYPVGREATISTPAPDLEFLNDSESGIFIDTSYTDTSITVSFYGTQEIEVESATGERRNITPPEEECRVNKALEDGEEVVVQEGLEGFDIVVDRILTFPDGEERIEHFSTHYLALPRIVERNSCRSEKKGEEREQKEDRGAGEARDPSATWLSSASWRPASL